MEERIKTEWKKAFSFNFEEKLNAHTQKLNKKKSFQLRNSIQFAMYKKC